MKKIILTLLLPVLFSVSCTSEFLEVTPTVTIPESQFYDTEEEINKALIAAYSPLQWMDFSYSGFHPIQFLADILADDYAGVGGAGEGDIPYLHLMNRYNLSAELSPLSLWKALYSGVYRSNQVIQNIDRVKDMNEAGRTRILAEARTLRAYYYHWLWRFWGNIPYYTTNPDGVVMDYIIPQLKADQVYEKIMEDLDFATEGNRLSEEVAVSEVGRFHRFSAYMLRARVVLTQEDETRYASVLTQMNEIIGSGIYALTPDFKEIWTDAGEWNCESIFEVNYSDDPSNRTWDNPYKPGGTVYPTFLCPDCYKGSALATEGYGFGPVSPALYNAYADEDSRRDASILNFMKALPGDSYNRRLDDTGFFNYKYLGRSGGHDQYIANGAEMNFRTNLRVFRYAETLLIAAELNTRLPEGNKTEAYTQLNTVRARAYGLKLEELDEKQSKAATLNNIFEEYRLEFALEGHRFWDLLRFGKADEMLSYKGFTASKRYLPIPQSEIDRSENSLMQNPY